MSQHVPKKLDYSLPEEIDLQVRTALPDLFNGTYRTVLYVGASHLRQHFLPEFVRNYNKVVVLEIFDENVRYLKNTYRSSNMEIICGDVRDVSSLSEKFDVCFFWHGPEHLHRHETKRVLDVLESITHRLVVLGMPYGHYKQGSEYGNVHESHQWDIYPEDMQDMGYKTNTIGKPDDTLANMMAWKHLGSV